MVELLEGRSLGRYLLEKYAKEPNGWSFCVFPPKNTRDGLGAFIASKDEIWRIQLDSAYSANPLMLGVKTELDTDRFPKTSRVSYGYRKLNEDLILRLLGYSQNVDAQRTLPESPRATTRTLDEVLSSITPVFPRANGAYAEGPIVMRSRKDLAPILNEQKDLEDKLSLEINQLLKKRYVSYG
jgi:hypothetical protein